jgi:mevalonate kinase
LAVDRGVTVHLTRRPGPTATAAHTPCDDRLAQALIAVLGPQGWEVELVADLPWGRGMGSSAAIAVGLARALAAAHGRVASADEVFDLAFSVERVFHGNPSGLDQAVSARGGLIWYRRLNPGQDGPPKREILDLPAPTYPVIVLDSGTAGDTRAMVASVAARRPAVNAILADIGALVERASPRVSDPEALGPLLTENHRLLQAIGVSTPALDHLVDAALEAGAWGAKLAGAGGGGVVLAVARDPAAVLATLQCQGSSGFLAHPVPATPEML